MRYATLFPLALLFGCASTEQPVVEKPPVTSALTTSRAFDVPALLGLDANEVARPLNSQTIRPDHDLTPRDQPSGQTESLYTYWHDTTEMEVI